VSAVGKQRAGKNSRVVVGATNLNFANWRCTWRGDDLDTTNFESAGFEQGTIGVVVAEWTMGGDWDAGRNNYDNPPGLYPRDDLGQVKFFENVTDATVFHNIATNRVLSAENGAEVKGKVTFTANGKSQGVSFSGLPAGSV
jgi:hypothetical protein